MFRVLPKFDRWTTYNYVTGAQRMALVKAGKFKLAPSKTAKSLWVVDTNLKKRRIKLLSKDTTLKYAKKTIDIWGANYAETLLSATKTGSLYYNIIHHFKSFDRLTKILRKD